MSKIIERYVDYISSMAPPAAWLATPTGTSLWIDGLSAIQSLEVGHMTDPTLIADVNDSQLLGLKILNADLSPLARTNSILVMNDYIATILSDFYRHIRNSYSNQRTEIKFVTSQESISFAPWLNTIELSTPHVSVYGGSKRIQFFTFHHEACHTSLFRAWYKRGPNESDQEVLQSLILIEWFCIAIDFVIAHQIAQAHPELRALEELANIENDSSCAIENRILVKSAKCKSFALSAAAELKSAFIRSLRAPVANANFEITERLIGRKTVDFHVKYAREELLRKLPASRDPSLRSKRRILTNYLMENDPFKIANARCKTI